MLKYFRNKFKTPSRTSPRNNRRACLCEDNTYHRDCCDGSLQAQGIGSITGTTPVTIYKYLATRCSDSHVSHVHIHGTELIVGKTYYLTLENGHNNCYTITQTHHSEGIHIISTSIPYNDCASCPNP